MEQVQMIKNAQISAMLLTRIQDGMTVKQAFDNVFGYGAYMEMAGELYDELRSKAK